MCILIVKSTLGFKKSKQFFNFSNTNNYKIIKNLELKVLSFTRDTLLNYYDKHKLLLSIVKKLLDTYFSCDVN